MKYTDFLRLYEEAPQYAELDLYIAERGWQNWMNSYSPEEIISHLELIYNMARLDSKGIRELVYSSRPKISNAFHIPIRTIEHWESKKLSDSRNMTQYLEGFYAFAIFSELTEGECEDDLSK